MKTGLVQRAFAFVMFVLFAHMPVAAARAAMQNAGSGICYECGESQLSNVSVPVSCVVLCGDSDGAVQQDVFFGMWDSFPGSLCRCGFCGRSSRFALCENTFLFAVMALQTFA